MSKQSVEKFSRPDRKRSTAAKMETQRRRQVRAVKYGERAR